MRLVETRMGKGSQERRGAEKTARQGKGASQAIGSAVAMLGDGERRHAVSEGRRIPVTFWAADGSCHEGTIPKLNREVLFVESAQPFPVSAEITLRFAVPIEGELDGGVATGTVIWVCHEEDHFMNRKGFGLRLQSRWPQPKEA